MITEERARELRGIIESQMENATDEIALSAPELFPQHDPEGHSYTTGDRFCSKGILYKVLQDHVSQPDWTPEEAVSLYAKVLIPTDEEGNQTSIDPWEQSDSTNTYGLGALVSHNGYIWESKHPHNSWEPGAVGEDIWMRVREA